MANGDARKLFVAGLSDSITEDVLRQLFEATGGTVVDVSLPKDRTTGRPRGFGFVTLSSSEEADSARESLDGSVQAGRAISVRPFSSEPPRRGPADQGRSGGGVEPRRAAPAGGERRPETSSKDDRTLYVGNLPYDTTAEELEQLLSESGVGPVVRMHLPVGADGRLRGFGFIALQSDDAVTSALVALRDVEVRGRRLMAKVAQPKGERPERTGGARPPRGPSSFRSSQGPDEEALIEGFEGSAKPLEGRRARESAREPVKKKTKTKTKRKSPEVRRGRGGASTWREWNDWDED